jgi:23S rRNA maturation mini-RNase III
MQTIALSRALRRALNKPSKPAKRRQIVQQAALLKTQPWRVRAILDPLDAALSDLMDRGLDVAEGAAIFKVTGRGVYQLAPAIEGVLAVIHIAKTRHGWLIDETPLERIMRRLKTDAIIFPHDVSAARHTVANLYPLFLHMRVTEAEALMRDAQIRFALEDAQ